MGKKFVMICLIVMCLFLGGCNIQACWGEEEEMTTTIDESELESLARIIMGEGEGSSWEFKVATGSVILNRVADDRFPGTIDDVIWQEGQWAPTWDGRYWLEPNQESWNAAEYVLTYGSQLPSDVVWESAITQGKYVYDYLEGIYFCG